MTGRFWFDQIETEVDVRSLSGLQFISDHPQTTSTSDETGRRKKLRNGFEVTTTWII